MNGFFNFRKLVVGVMAATCFMGFQSCLDDDDDYPYSKVLPNALVTVKPVDDGSYFLQLDDSTTLLPVNMTSSPFGQKEVRALVNFDETNESSGIYSKAVNINWIDSILTKPIAPDLGVTSNDSIYGSDPVEIVNDWVTIAEDGYLTLRFRTIWGDRNKAHFVNLLTGKDPENPYEVEFRQCRRNLLSIVHETNPDKPPFYFSGIRLYLISGNRRPVLLHILYHSPFFPIIRHLHPESINSCLRKNQSNLLQIQSLFRIK